MGTRTPTLYTGNVTGTVGSLITALDAALVTGEGWTTLYSGTNEKVYRSADSSFVLQVLDNGTVTGGAREAVARTAESATALTTLVNPFPTIAQLADNACVWRKSNTLDATNRPYRIVADGNWVWFEVEHNTNSRELHGAGKYERAWPGDNYNVCLITRAQANSATSTVIWSGGANQLQPQSFIATARLYHMRTADGLTLVDWGNTLSVGVNFGLAAATVYPHSATNKLHCRMVESWSSGQSSSVTAAKSMRRGYLPFLLEPLHTTFTGAAVGDTFTDTAYDAGSTFVLSAGSNTLGVGAQWVLQTAGTWDPSKGS